MVFFGLAACTILDSDRVDQSALEECTTSLGHYFLPKRYLRVNIAQAGSRPSLVLTATENFADARYKYCLAFNGSALAEDSITVERYDVAGRSRGLLKSIRSQAADKTKEVVETVLDAVAIGATRNPNMVHRSLSDPLLQNNMLLSRAFDPFDPAQLAGVNVELAEFGYCIKFDAPRASNPGFATGCGRAAHLYVKADPYAWQPDASPRKEHRGIFYRPNLMRKFIVLYNKDPDGRGTWSEVQDYNFPMPNEAPIFSVDVTRSMFVTKETKLDFDQGVLTNVTIDKPSELANFVEIPLRMVEVVVAIPAQIVKVRINNINNRAAIIAAQQKLLEVQAQRKTLEDQLAGRQRSVQFADVVNPNRQGPTVGGPSSEPVVQFDDPRFRAQAEDRCGDHCKEAANRSRIANPLTCARTCVQVAQRCLTNREQPTPEECGNLGIKSTEQQ